MHCSTKNTEALEKTANPGHLADCIANLKCDSSQSAKTLKASGVK